MKEGARVRLSEWDCEGAKHRRFDKNDEKEVISSLREKLSELQGLLYAEHKHKVLIILQAMDTAGKDSVIKHVFEGVNPQGVRVATFKEPTSRELDHDYLWRVHKEVPAKGEIVIFNRSHYEDVLAVRVHELVPERVWRRRFDQINDFERMLSEEGVIILKFFLHIDKAEQKKRLMERLEDTAKNWKFSASDLRERSLWSVYTKAYEDALGKTSTAWAPWHIIPSNRRWHRNLVVSRIIVKTLEGLRMEYPRAKEKINISAIK